LLPPARSSWYDTTFGVPDVPAASDEFDGEEVAELDNDGFAGALCSGDMGDMAEVSGNVLPGGGALDLAGKKNKRRRAAQRRATALAGEAGPCVLSQIVSAIVLANDADYGRLFATRGLFPGVPFLEQMYMLNDHIKEHPRTSAWSVTARNKVAFKIAGDFLGARLRFAAWPGWHCSCGRLPDIGSLACELGPGCLP
jgi:hypothetical protein